MLSPLAMPTGLRLTRLDQQRARLEFRRRAGLLPISLASMAPVADARGR